MVLETEKVFPRGGNVNSNRAILPRSNTFQTLVEGMVLLSRVRRVDNSSLSVCLPGHICGRVSISDVSKPYSTALQALAQSADQPQPCLSLEQMFQVGQPIVVRVEALGAARTDVRLTTDPGRLQGHWPRSMLTKGASLVAAVRSVEDHVYVMDVGLRGVRAFLKKTGSHKYLQTFTAGVGQVLRCVIVKADVTSASVTLELSADPQLANTVIPSHSLTLDSLVPGVRCEVAVSKVLSDGLAVRLTDHVIGHVHRNHLMNPLDQLDSYHEEQEYTATLLYVMPIVKLPYLSLSSTVCPAKPTMSPFESLAIGAFVDDCVVISVDGQGVVLQLGNQLQGLRGYVSHRRALGAANHNLSLTLMEEVKSKYPIGSHHRCRILDYDFVDQMYICSTERKLLKAKHIHPSSVKVGQHVWCEIDSIGHQTANVFVLGGEKSDYRAFTAYVPVLHFCDIPLRHLEKKFLPGSRWRARVLSVEDLHVKVTLQPSLVNSDLPVLASYEDARKGQAYDGSVYRILENGLMIKFYGKVAGFVPRVVINADVDVDLESLFYVGQTVRCYVLEVKLQQEGLFLTLEQPVGGTHTHSVPQPPSEEVDAVEVTPENESEENCILRVGQMYKVLVDEVKEGCLEVSGKLEGSTWTGKIPAHHLTDCSALAESLLESCPAGKKLKAYCWSAKENILTLRHSAIKFFKDERNAAVMREGLSAAEGGSLVPCSVRSVDPTGNMLLQVPLPNSPGTLQTPLRELGDTSHCVVETHKGLIGCVQFSRKKKPKLSVKLSDVCSNFTESAVELLQSYILSLNIILHHGRTSGSVLYSVAPGDRVGGVVKEVSDAEVIVKLKPSGILCTVPLPHQRKGRLKPGSKAEGTVLFTDPVAGCIHITLRPLIISRIASIQDGKLPDEVHVGSILRAQVVLVKEDFVLVTLFGRKGQCRLAYIPTRCHMNQLFPDTNHYCVGEKRHVIVRRIINGMLIVVFKEIGKKCSSEVSTKGRKNVEIKGEKRPSTLKAETQQVINQRSVLVKKPKKVKSGGEKVSKCSSPEIQSSVSTNGPLLLDSEDINGCCGGVKNKAKSDRVGKNRVKPECKVETRDASLHNDNESDERIESEAISNYKANSVKRSNSTTREAATGKSEHAASNKKRKLKERVTDDRKDSTGSEGVVTKPEVNVSESAPALEVDFVWDPKPGQLPAVLGGEPADSDTSSEDEAQQQGTKKKRLSAAEKKELARQEEARIRELEMKLMNESQNPQTADDFDRLVLASPNSSALWVQYMAFHLQATEIEKARAVAEKALKMVSFREEAEKLNVWVALLNLENLYGTAESLDKVLKDAVQMNDAQTVYLKMLQIYCASNKVQEAELLANLVCKKFKDKQDVWVQAGTVCMKLGLVDKARSLLQRALASLDKKLHVLTISKFSQLEQQWGSAERAQALMEQVLTSYPQRVDVWSSYVDMLVKSGSLDIARQLLERAVVQKLSTRRMRTLFKKYLQFEETHGTPEGVARVRRMAVDYVQAITSKLDDD